MKRTHTAGTVLRYCLAMLCPAVAYTGCGSAAEATHTTDYVLQGDTVVLKGGSLLAAQLKVDTVQSAPYRMQLFTAGTVKAIPNHYAEIAPPFPGRVLRSFVRLGMKVEPGTALFEISSPDFTEAQKSCLQAQSQLLLAEKTWRRQQDLLKHGVGIQKDLEEAETAYEVARKEYENACAAIRVFKADPQQLVLGQPLVVKSPIAGEVVDNKIVVGQFIKDDAAAVATVAALSEVWVAGQVKEKDLGYIQSLDSCTIDVAAYPGRPFSGKLYHINELVDEDTRSVQVLVSCENTAHLLKPGMYVTVHFLERPTTVLRVPARAVLQSADASFVYVQVSDGRYVRRKVQTGNTTGNDIVITSGVQAGDQILSQGGFYLLDAK